MINLCIRPYYTHIDAACCLLLKSVTKTRAGSSHIAADASSATIYHPHDLRSSPSRQNYELKYSFIGLVDHLKLLIRLVDHYRQKYDPFIAESAMYQYAVCYMLLLQLTIRTI